MKRVIRGSVKSSNSKPKNSLKESLNLNEVKNIINVLNKNLRVQFKHSAGGIFYLDRTPFNEDTFNKLIKNNYKMIGDILEEQGLKYDISEDAYISKDENLYVTIYGDTGTIIVQFDEMKSESLNEKVALETVKSTKYATFKNDKRLSTIDASVTFSNFVLDSKGKLHATSDLLKGYIITKDTSFICPRDEYSLVEIYSDEDGQHVLQCTHCQTQYAYEDDDLESFQEI